MSSSIAIPKRKKPVAARHILDSHMAGHGHHHHHGHSARHHHYGDAASSSSSSLTTPDPGPVFHAASPSSSSSASSPRHFSTPAFVAGPAKPMPAPAPTPAAVGGERHFRERRPSLLSASLARSEHVVVNVGHPDAPRLISCVKASQGFDWNQDIFLPSYLDHDSIDLERKQDPVEDIVLTEEEAAAIYPH